MHLAALHLHAEQFPTREFYPFNVPVLRETDSIAFDSPVTFFVGENGTGKSTLLEAIAHKCGIHIWANEDRLRFARNPYEKKLHQFISLTWDKGSVPGSFFASQIFNEFAHNLDEWAATDPGLLNYFGGESLVTKSHGQSLMAFFESRFRIKGLYLLDEPETALSPAKQLDLIGILQETGRAGHAQFIIATHSPILLACPGARIWSFDSIPARPTSYKDTAHFRLYRDFLNCQ